MEGRRLNDRHIGYAQMLLKVQHPKINGLQSTLKPSLIMSLENAIQIVHCQGDHWIVASTVADQKEVTIYDSLFTALDHDSEEIVRKYFGNCIQIKMSADCPQQIGELDCGVFSIMFATILSRRCDPCKSSFTKDSVALRSHLVKCFNNGLLYPLGM